MISEETRKKMSDARKLAWSTPSYRDRLVRAHIGYVPSIETKAKHSAAMLGKNKNAGAFHLGRKRSAETRAKMRANIASWSDEKRKKASHLRSINNVGKKRTESTRKKIQIARLTQAPCNKSSKLEHVMCDKLNELGIVHKTNVPAAGISIADIFIEPNIYVYVDGCFWHKCPTHFKADSVDMNSRMIRYILGATERDDKVSNTLIAEGNIVVRLWEHDIKHDINKCVRTITECTKRY